jgi:hypothetical protein
MTPRPQRSQWHAPQVRSNTASKRGVAAALDALQALYGAPADRSPEQLLAERERLRIEADQQRSQQAALPLRGGV